MRHRVQNLCGWQLHGELQLLTAILATLEETVADGHNA